MLGSVVQLWRGQLRIVVYVVGSCWWWGQLSVLAHHTHMLYSPPVPTSSWMICSDRPQFVVSSDFKAVHCFLLRSSPLMPSPGSDMWLWTWVGPDASRSCCQAAAIHASLDRSLGMTLHLLSLHVVRLTGLESTWRHFIVCRVVQDVPVVFHCFPCQGKGGCFPA